MDNRLLSHDRFFDDRAMRILNERLESESTYDKIKAEISKYIATPEFKAIELGFQILAGVSSDRFQNEVREQLGNIRRQLAQINAKLDEILEHLKALPDVIEGIVEDKLILAAINEMDGREEAAGTYLDKLPNPRDLSPEDKNRAISLLDDHLSLMFGVSKWGPIGYPIVFRAISYQAAALKALGIEASTFEPRRARVITWFSQAVAKLNESATNLETETEAERLLVANHPLQVYLITPGVPDEDNPPAPQPGVNWTSFYCIIEPYSVDGTEPSFRPHVKSDGGPKVNGRNWPRSPLEPGGATNPYTRKDVMLDRLWYKRRDYQVHLPKSRELRKHADCADAALKGIQAIKY